MARSPIATPCPVSQSASSLPLPIGGRRQSNGLSAFQDDTLTIDIDYTRAIAHQIKNVPPRRKSTFQRKAEAPPAITIFEDVLEDQELVFEQPKPELQGRTLLGKRAQKIPAGRAPQAIAEEKSAEDVQPLKPIGQARRRSSIVPHAEETRAIDFATGVPMQQEVAQGVLKKNPRRRTIFVPSEDTTILTIHPGAQTTGRLDDTFQLPNLAAQTSAAANVSIMQDSRKDDAKSARRPRMSLSVAPKRVPLQQRPGISNNLAGFDVPGQNGGKENLPPNGDSLFKKPKAVKEESVLVSEARPASRSRLFEPTAASQARKSVVVRDAVPLPNKNMVVQKGRIAPRASIAHRRSMAPMDRTSWQYQEDKHHESPRPATTPVLSGQPAIKPAPRRRSPTAKLQHYPVLTEDLAQPELYEDNWLSQQEISLTEIINQIFSDASIPSGDNTHRQRSLRDRMIAIYHQPKVTTLHKRLQASLLCGALSRPKDLPVCTDPAADIGLRKTFLSLWLKSYDEEALRTAAEVVFGRQLPNPTDAASPIDLGASESHLDPLKNRRALTCFLETFLVECCDVERLDDGVSTGEYFATQRWRKMVLRSLMLVWLLDQTKVSKEFGGCLFQRSSPRKTSEAMLNALSSMLMPSVGDISRGLRHLGYEVGHVQDPLDEVEYRICNIAVDLRDGIFLTRLVELLLFARNHLSKPSDDENATVTVQMPDAMIIESLLWNQDGSRSLRLLSQHLKMPCLGRAQKLYNVQLALSALNDHGKLGAHVGLGLDMTAEDIVDGHREKTLSLLWSLVGTYGLDELIDWNGLVDDTRRTCSSNGTIHDDHNKGGLCNLSQSRQESLLKAWASSYCGSQGLRISNLTTSFADGKAYAIIVGCFTRYLNSSVVPSSRPFSSSSNSSDLDKSLRSLGCSAAFTKQLISSTHTIPSRRTTVSNLAFLASRLLPLARQFNAAMVLQRAYRLRLKAKAMSRRIALARLAHACATVVLTQQRLVGAAVVLQRAWRGVVDGKIRRLDGDVRDFQCLARGWLARRRTKLVVREGYYQGSQYQSLKVMGGW